MHFSNDLFEFYIIFKYAPNKGDLGEKIVLLMYVKWHLETREAYTLILKYYAQGTIGSHLHL